MVKKTISQKLFGIFNLLFLGFLCAAVLVPLLKTLSESLVNHTVYGIRMFDELPDFIAYKALALNCFKSELWVSLATTFATAFLGVFISSIAAYILIRRDMPGVKIFKWLLLITLIFDAGFIPRFLVIKKLGLLNSLWAIILPMSINAGNIFLLKTYFEQLPKTLFEAAEIDGCGPMKTFFMIALPLARGPLAVIGLFFATAAWNEYFSYILYISDTAKYNMQYAVRDIFTARTDVSDVFVNLKTLQCAKIVACILPALVVCPLFLHFADLGTVRRAGKDGEIKDTNFAALQ
ncbi:MAG: carbohydrate ABC transporter permease [Firmicutes bacterium]|nr:carbohydrate ABC transporter permease [Bacillota bacterium]